MISFVESDSNRAEDARLRRRVEELLRPSQARLAPVQVAIRSGFEENFITESAGGTPWAPLAPMTVAQRLLQGYGGAHPILQRSGDYRSAFTRLTHPNHVSTVDYGGGVTRVGEGSNHSFTSRLELGEGKVPARPVLVLSSAAKNDVDDAVVEMFTRILHA